MTAGIFLASIALSRFPILKTSEGLEGHVAPEISFVGPDGKPSKLSEKQNTVVLLYFWSIWCDECLKELPLLSELENHFSGKGFILFAFDLAGKGESIRGKISGGALQET